MKKNKAVKAKPVERAATLSENQFIHFARGCEPPELTDKQIKARALYARDIGLREILTGLGISPADLFQACGISIVANRELYDEMCAHASRYKRYGNPLMESEPRHETTP